MLRKLANIHGEGSILPQPAMQVQRRTIRGCQVAVVTVEPSGIPPVRYKGRVWVRVGPTVREASVDDERILTERRRSLDLPFDQRPIPGATRQDLDLHYIRTRYLPAVIAPDILERNARPLESQLESLRLTREGIPTGGAILAFGKDPLGWIGSAWIQFVRFEGNRITDPIQHQATFTGRLEDTLNHLRETLRLNIRIRTEVEGHRTEFRQPDYPLEALLQLTWNAVMHRNYEGTHAPIRIYWYRDRVEILSVGGPFGNVHQHNFGDGTTDYRNRLVAEIMKGLGFAQRFGLGIPIAQRALQRNGNPTVEFEVSSSSVAATVRAAP